MEEVTAEDEERRRRTPPASTHLVNLECGNGPFVDKAMGVDDGVSRSAKASMGTL